MDSETYSSLIKKRKYFIYKYFIRAKSDKSMHVIPVVQVSMYNSLAFFFFSFSIIERFELEGSFRDHLVPNPCCGQEHPSLYDWLHPSPKGQCRSWVACSPRLSPAALLVSMEVLRDYRITAGDGMATGCITCW